MMFHSKYLKQEYRSTRQRQRSQDATPDTPQVGHPEGTKPKSGVAIRALKGEGHVMCEKI
jgi:hypothetical protein